MYFDPVSALNLPDGTELAPIGRRIGSWFLATPLAIVTLDGYVIRRLIVGPRDDAHAAGAGHADLVSPDGAQRRLLADGAAEIVGGIATGILNLITELLSFVLMVTGRARKCLADHIASTMILRDPDNRLANLLAATSTT